MWTSFSCHFTPIEILILSKNIGERSGTEKSSSYCTIRKADLIARFSVYFGKSASRQRNWEKPSPSCRYFSWGRTRKINTVHSLAFEPKSRWVRAEWLWVIYPSSYTITSMTKVDVLAATKPHSGWVKSQCQWSKRASQIWGRSLYATSATTVVRGRQRPSE